MFITMCLYSFKDVHTQFCLQYYGTKYACKGIASPVGPSGHLSDTKQTFPFEGRAPAIYGPICVGAGHNLLRMCKPPAGGWATPPRPFLFFVPRLHQGNDHVHATDADTAEQMAKL